MDTLPDRPRRILISVFVLFHMVAFTAWTVPLNFPLINLFKQELRPYLLFTGLFQAWDMFSPDPLRTQSYVQAEVQMANGQIRIWRAPRMQDLGLVDKYFKERYRKFVNEHLRLDTQAMLWPDAARHIARLLDDDKSNPPVNVRLVRYWSDNLPPGPDGEYRHTPLNHYTYFSYDVQPEDLE